MANGWSDRYSINFHCRSSIVLVSKRFCFCWQSLLLKNKESDDMEIISKFVFLDGNDARDLNTSNNCPGWKLEEHGNMKRSQSACTLNAWEGKFGTILMALPQRQYCTKCSVSLSLSRFSHSLDSLSLFLSFYLTFIFIQIFITPMNCPPLLSSV